MQKRFGPKDLTLIAILAVLFITILLVMYMIDRQWTKLSEMESSMKEQSRDIRELRNQLKTGGLPAAASRSGKLDMPPSFKRAYAASQQPDYSEGDWRVLSFAQGIKTITPLVSTDVYASYVHEHVLETLLKYDPESLELIGHIARSWIVSKDGLEITFKIRDDVHFSDGEPLTADDIVFSFNFIMDDRIAAPRHRAYYSKIKEVISEDKFTVKFVFKEPYFNALLLAGTLEIMPKHFYEPYLQKPNDFNQSKGLLLGSGPYRLKDPRTWSPDKGLVELVRNPRYWGPVSPSYDRVIWKVIENDSARLTTFRNGEIDVYSARAIEYEKLKSDQALMKRVRNLEYYPAINPYFFIAWNQRRNNKPTIFSDKRVRQALTYLTDREKIIDEVFLGYGEVAVSPFNPRSPQHNTEVKPRSYNINKAKALLKSAGFEDRDGDGIIEDKNGKKFEFEFYFVGDSAEYKRIVLMLKDAYAKAGIVVKPKSAEWPVMLELTDNKDYDAMFMGWSSVVETDLYQAFHSSQSMAKGDNYVSYNNPKIDKLIEKARETVDKEARMKYWHQAEVLLFEDQPYTFLLRRKSLVFVDKRMKNVQVTKFGINIQNTTPIETYTPLNLQKYSN